MSIFQIEKLKAQALYFFSVEEKLPLSIISGTGGFQVEIFSQTVAWLSNDFQVNFCTPEKTIRGAGALACDKVSNP